MKQLLFSLLLLPLLIKAQTRDTVIHGDTTIIINNGRFTLKDVVVRSGLDYKILLRRIQQDTTFYKAFRNLHIVQYTSLNNVRMLDKKGNGIASLNSETLQHHENGCRWSETLQQQTTGNFLNKQGNNNYLTGEMYASIFIAKNKICGENNVVAGNQFSMAGKSGIEKHKIQLKMLFFNPGEKIPGIPFIGNKLDLYDNDAHKLYDYSLDYDNYKGIYVYIFSIKPKTDLGLFRRDDIVVDNMTTWFDAQTMEVLARKYSLSYNAGVYDFAVNIEVEMTHIGNLLVPQSMRYKGNFSVLTKKRERGEFTATLFNYKL